MVELVEYVTGRKHIPHIVGYDCGCWMCTDVNRFPARCPECGARAVAAHEFSQEVFEDCLVYSSFYQPPKFKKKKQKKRK